MLRQNRVQVAGKAGVKQTRDNARLRVEISNQEGQLEVGLVVVLQQQRHLDPLDPSPAQHLRLMGIPLYVLPRFL